MARRRTTKAECDRLRTIAERRVWDDFLPQRDAEIAKLRTRLDRATMERLHTTPGSEADASLRRTIAELENEIARAAADRAALTLTDASGLSEEEGCALRDASSFAEGIDDAGRYPTRVVDQREVHIA